MSTSANDVAVEDQELPWAAGDPGPTVAAVLAGSAGRTLRTVLPEGGALPGAGRPERRQRRPGRGRHPRRGARQRRRRGSATSPGWSPIGLLSPWCASRPTRLPAGPHRHADSVPRRPGGRRGGRRPLAHRRPGASRRPPAASSCNARTRSTSYSSASSSPAAPLDELCHALAEVFGGLALVTSTDGRVLANAGTDGDPSGCWPSTASTAAVACSSRTSPWPKAPTATRARPPQPGQDRRRRLRARPPRRFHPRSALLRHGCPPARSAATVAALVVTKEQAVSAVEGKYRAEFLRDALAGRSGSPTETIAHAAALGWDVDRRLVVVVAETDENDAETTRAPRSAPCRSASARVDVGRAGPRTRACPSPVSARRSSSCSPSRTRRTPRRS